jgi:hypothetical protein
MLRDQFLGNELDADRVLRERLAAHPRVGGFCIREGVDLRFDAVAVRIAVVEGKQSFRVMGEADGGHGRDLPMNKGRTCGLRICRASAFSARS